MTKYICVQCGTQFSDSPTPPDGCPICLDYRQYVNWQGQQWTTLEEIRAKHTNAIRSEGPRIYGIGSEPSFAIGQRALLVQAQGGNILWDCISLIDDATVAAIRDLGGLTAIAISHPHFYSCMSEWSRAFGGVPIYLHAANREWVMQPDPAIRFWEGDTCAIADGLTLVRVGIHFEGGTLLHWADGAERRGALCVGDMFQVAADRRYVSFMRSYPNMIPESPQVIRDALRRVSPFAFDTIYGMNWDKNVATDAKAAVWRSADRYLEMVGAGSEL